MNSLRIKIIGSLACLLLNCAVYAQPVDSASIEKLLKFGSSLAHEFPDSTLMYCDQAWKATEELQLESLQPSILSLTSLAHLMRNDPVAAQEAITKLLKHPHLDPTNQYRALLMRANVFNTFYKDHFASIQHLLKAKKLAEENELPISTAAVYTDLGTNFSMVKNYEEATRYFTKALEMADDDYRKAGALYNLANTASEEGDTLKAIDLSLKAVQLWKKHDAKTFQQYAYNLLVALYSTSDPELAQAYLDTSTALSMSTDSPRFRTWAILAKARMLLAQGKCDAALAAFLEVKNKDQYDVAPSEAIKEVRNGLLTVYQCLDDEASALAMYAEIAKAKEQEELEHNQRISDQLDQYLSWTEELDLAQNQASASRAEADQVSRIAIIIGVSLVFMCVALVYILSLIRKTKRINRELADTNQEKQSLLEELKESNHELSVANSQISQMNLNLEQKIEDRTAEILRKKETLNNYVFWNAHRLRGPLANMIGLLDLLRTGPKKESEMTPDEIYELLHQSIQKMDDTVREFNRDLSDS